MLAVFIPLLLLLQLQSCPDVKATCSVQQCDARAIFVVPPNGDVLYDIAARFEVEGGFATLQTVNNISNVLALDSGRTIHIPFSCVCTEQLPGHIFHYSAESNNQTYTSIASYQYGNLTRPECVAFANPSAGINATTVVPNGVVISIPVNCSCGDSSISEDYGLFGTYVIQPDDTLSNLSRRYFVPEDTLQRYNPTVAFDHLKAYFTIVFIPLTNSSGLFPPFTGLSFSPETGVSKSVIWGIGAGVTGAAVLASVGLLIWLIHIKNVQNFRKDSFLSDIHTTHSFQLEDKSRSASYAFSDVPPGGFFHFSYEELASITNNFNMSREIGRGGYATVYYGEFRGQKLAIKKMASKEVKGFMNEMKVLSTVHHSNLVQLVGYCTEMYLFLVYEYVDNGSLNHHLRLGKNGRQALSWEQRVQIAQDAARGIEYIHDHTKPTYVHRDIKPHNILIDKNYHAKVGDFGITKYIDPDCGGPANSSAVHGTFGYIAPEYAMNQRVSDKMDVYAFGVVLFQLVSAQEAIIHECLPTELVKLFKDILSKPNAREAFRALVDPALGDTYPVESLWKMVLLADRCTDLSPELRPPMREVVSELSNLHDQRQ